MNTGKTLFAQVIDFLPWKTFQRIADRYEADHGVRTLSCVEQFRVMAFAQLCYRERLRDIEVGLAAQALPHGDQSEDCALDATTIDLCLSVLPWSLNLNETQ
jgi:hypothetical protein